MPSRVDHLAFYTPNDAAEFVARWAISCPAMTVFDPSAGGGSLLHAYEHAREAHEGPPTICACDIDKAAVDALAGPDWHDPE